MTVSAGNTKSTKPTKNAVNEKAVFFVSFEAFVSSKAKL